MALIVDVLEPIREKTHETASCVRGCIEPIFTYCKVRRNAIGASRPYPRAVRPGQDDGRQCCNDFACCSRCRQPRSPRRASADHTWTFTNRRLGASDLPGA
jgi:hypothetical protein